VTYRCRVLAALPLSPPVIEQPAPRQSSYGLVTGVAARGTRRVVVSARGRVLADRSLHRRHFSLRVSLPSGDLTLRVTTIGAGHRRSVALVHDVLGLPRAARPRFTRAHQDAPLARRVRALARGYRGIPGIYIQSLTDGTGAAWNAKARFPAASTLKLAIATTVLAASHGVPQPGSYLDGLLRQMLVVSDNASANALEVWLGGSTSGGAARVDALVRSIGLRDTIMYGGYEIGTYARRIPLEVDEQPSFGFGKYTTAWDLARLFRAVWLASGGRGPFRTTHSGFTTTDARYLLWILGHVRDTPKLDRIVRRSSGVEVLHKAGWIDSARHDAGLVFWPGGVFVASVLTWNPRGAGVDSDMLAGRCADTALRRFRRLHA
jgi:Beta-lactamase enzyme family